MNSWPNIPNIWPWANFGVYFHPEFVYSEWEFHTSLEEKVFLSKDTNIC